MRTPAAGSFRRLVAALALVSAGLSGAATVGAADAPKPTAAKAAESPRAPDATERAAMVEILKGESATERAAWLSYAAGNGEPRALAEALAGVFRDAGWKADVSALTGMRLKPGVLMLVADEQPPAWAETALRALQASGIEVNSATGYRAYADEMKAKNPAWTGVPMAKDAAFVIVVGPEPPKA